MNISHFPSGCCGAFKHTIRFTLPSGVVVAITGAGKSPTVAKRKAQEEFDKLFGAVAK